MALIALIFILVKLSEEKLPYQQINQQIHILSMSLISWCQSLAHLPLDFMSKLGKETQLVQARHSREGRLLQNGGRARLGA